MAQANLGNVLSQLKRYDEAIIHLNKAIELKPDANKYKSLGATFIDKKSYNEAIEQFKKVLEYDPNDTYAHFQYGFALKKLKRYEKAVEQFQIVLNINPEDYVARCNMAILLSQLERYDEAIEHFNKTIKINPKYAFAYYYFGNTFTDLMRYDDAIEQYEKAISVDSNLAIVHDDIAYLLWEQGKYKNALEHWEKARDAYTLIYTQKEITYFNKEGIIYYFGILLGSIFDEYNEAENIYKEGLSNYPNNVGIMVGLLFLYLEKIKNSSDDTIITDNYWNAQNLYKKIKTLLQDNLKNTNDRDSFFLLGQLQLNMEEYEDAKNNLLKSLEIGHESAELYANLGVLYTRLEDFQKAARYFENAVRYDPYNFKTRCNLAEVYLKLNIIEKAEVEFKKILLITANHVESQLGLGEVYTIMGDNGNVDMYYQAINHFTAGINSSSPGKGSKELNKKELAAVLYSRGYSKVKLYEALPLLAKDKKLLRDAVSDFKECFKNDPNQYRAERAFEKIEKILENYSVPVMEKIGQCILFVISLIILIGSQYLFIRGKPRSIKESPYIILTFGSLLFIVASIYLPNVLKLKVAGLELEKNTINQITTLPTLKLEKIFSFDSGRR